MWAALLGKNAGVRYLQPKIIDIVAFRSIQLYSGKLGTAQGGMQSSAENEGSE